MKMQQLLLFLHLLAKQTRGKEPLVDYSKFHVVINVEYLTIMETVIAEVIRKTGCKEREESRV
jgi:hypothetical protein